jgi:hypothetical protein
MRILGLVLLLALLPGTAFPATLLDPQIGFSADRTLVVDGHSYKGKIWAMPGKERHEQTIQGMRPVFLLHSDSPLGELVLAGLKTVVQFEIPTQLRVLAIPELKKNPIGPDTVNGIATTKYAIDKTIAEGHAKGTLWLSREGIPMRLTGTFTSPKGRVSQVRWELTHVRTGPQPASLFEPPKGLSTLPPEAIAPLLGLKLKAIKGR